MVVASSADQLDAVLPAFEEPLGDDILAALDEATRDATLEWAQ
jgi:aryl-alcohol dehydrogenase-like predicted oxidoreductase